ncbi:MAG TPA: hypothetical protein VNA25_27345 [Phycisphaerae bacterium]|nr:hypothetical protein [Phycisphaerae bacterium]
MSGETTTTELANVIQTYFERTAYAQLAYNVVFDTYARLLPLPSGNTVRVPLLTPYTVIKSNLSEVPTTLSAASLIPNYMEKSVDFFGAYTDLSKKGVKSSLLDAVKYARMQLEQQAARSINRRYAEALCSQDGARYLRVADSGSTTQRNLTVGAGPTTTQALIDAPLTGEDSANYPGGQVFFTTGVNTGLARRITSASSVSSIVSYISNALPQAPSAGDLVDIVTLTAVSTTTTYRMDLTDVFRMAELARRNGAQGFSPGGRVREDGWGIMRNTAGTVPQLAIMMDTQVALDIMLDSATNGYTDVFKNTDGAMGRYSKGQFGLINNVSFIGHNEGWRMSTARAESDTGVVHTPVLVGQNVYFATKFRGVGNNQDGLQFRVKTPGPQTFSVRHEAVIARIEWDAWMAVGVQNGLHGVVGICGASSDA